jgi:hypothetical protein
LQTKAIKIPIWDGSFEIQSRPGKYHAEAPQKKIEDYPNKFSIRESVDMIITEYGVATLQGRTVRGRAQAIIEIPFSPE